MRQNRPNLVATYRNLRMTETCLSCVQTDLCRITMSGKVSDLPIGSKRALFRQKKLDRINFKSGKRGRVVRNPPGVATGQGVSRVVGNVHGHMILCHMVGRKEGRNIFI